MSVKSILSISNCAFHGGFGKAAVLYAMQQANITIADSLFEENYSVSASALTAIDYLNFSLTNSTFQRNQM